jgi:putative hydroxymethylpyrimidine transport system ATP-binding protein
LTAAAVEVRGLQVGYGDPRQPQVILAGVEFSLRPGERLAVVGQSGGGKSTLLHTLAGLMAPLAGQVEVDGVTVAAADLDGSGRSGCRSGHAAYMFQQDLLLPWKTVLGNAAFAAQVAGDPGGASDGGATAGKKREARRDRVGLEQRARAILEEFGLGDALGMLPRDLSGGMRQRVALARTLVLGRGLVLLDEPFGSLDALTRAEMHYWLLEAMQTHPATWVLVTHDVREAVLLGDRVAVLAGKPAHLSGWLEVPLTERERLGLAALETVRGEGEEDGSEEDGGEVGDAGPETASTVAEHLPAAAEDFTAAAETLAGLAGRARSLLGRRRGA